MSGTRYGDGKTSLVLTEKALAAYSESDPLDIIETDDGVFSMRGIEDRDNMTAEQVNTWLECLYDEIF